MYRAYAAGEPVGLVDLDLGQSHLGPPATLGLGLFPPLAPGDDGLFPQGLYFIGQTSPLGAILEVAVGCRVLADQAAGRGHYPAGGQHQRLHPGARGPAPEAGPGGAAAARPDPGLAAGTGAGAAAAGAWEEGQGAGSTTSLPLRHSRIDFEMHSGWQILRLPVSSRVSRRDPEDAAPLSGRALSPLFSSGPGMCGCPGVSFTWEGLPLGRGRPLPPWRLRSLAGRLGIRVLYGEGQGRRAVLLTEQPPPDPAAAESAGRPDWDHVHWLSWEALQLRLVGLLDGRHRTLALGLILPVAWDRENLALLTPLAPEAAARVRFVKLGKLRLNLEGQELPHV